MLANFERHVLGCIDAKFCKYILQVSTPNFARYSKSQKNVRKSSKLEQIRSNLELEKTQPATVILAAVCPIRTHLRRGPRSAPLRRRWSGADSIFDPTSGTLGPEPKCLLFKYPASRREISERTLNLASTSVILPKPHKIWEDADSGI